MATPNIINQDDSHQIHLLDEELSQRFISLDPNGYFLIKLDNSSKELVVDLVIPKSTYNINNLILKDFQNL